MIGPHSNSIYSGTMDPSTAKSTMYVIPNYQTSTLKILVEQNSKKVLGLEWNEAKTSGVEDEASSGLIVGDASIWRLRGMGEGEASAL